MKINRFPATLLAVLFSASCLGSLHAQGKTEFTIKKIEPALVEAPQIAGGAYRKQQPGGGRPVPWLEVDLTFERDELSKDAPKFADDITVNFYILLNNAAGTPDKQSTLLTGSATLSDVPFGKGLHAAAFVSPQTLARYFEGKVPASVQQAVIDVGVTISNSTGLVAMASSKNPEVARKGKGWWEAESGMTTVAGRILEKSQTPFAPFAWDYYLPSKSQSAN